MCFVINYWIMTKHDSKSLHRERKKEQTTIFEKQNWLNVSNICSIGWENLTVAVGARFPVRRDQHYRFSFSPFHEKCWKLNEPIDLKTFGVTG